MNNIISARHALLKAIMNTITEMAVQKNAHNAANMAASPAGVLMIMPNTFQFTQNQFYNFGVHINNVTSTSIPIIFNGNTPEEILDRIQRYAYDNNGIMVVNVELSLFEEQVIKKYGEITGDLFTVSFPQVNSMNPGERIINLLQEAVNDEFGVLCNYIASNVQTPNICTQAVGKIGPAMFQQNRFYESLSGIGFKILGEVNSVFTIELQFTEPIMRTAKRDKVFTFNSAAWGFLNNGLAR